jgi:putative methylase
VKKAKMFGCDVQVIAELKFDVPQMYKFHREKSKDIVVDLIRFSW